MTREEILQAAYNHGFEKGAKPFFRPLGAAIGSFIAKHPKARNAALEAGKWGLSGLAANKLTDMEYGGTINPFLDADHSSDVGAKERILAKALNTMALRYTPSALRKPGVGVGANLQRAGAIGALVGSTPTIRGVQGMRNMGGGLGAAQQNLTNTTADIQKLINRVNKTVDTVGSAAERASGSIESGIEDVRNNVTEGVSGVRANLEETTGQARDSVAAISSPVERAASNLQSSTDKFDKVLEGINKIVEREPSELETQLTRFLSGANRAGAAAKNLPWRNIGYGAAGLGALYGGSKLINALRSRAGSRTSKKKKKQTDPGSLTPAQRKRLALELEAYERGRQRQ